MLKKTRGVAVVLNRGFQNKVTSLAEEGRELAKSYSALSARMLHFAEKFRRLLEEARTLDNDNDDDGAHQQFLRSALADAVQSSSPSTWSKWSMIGAQAKMLLPYKDSIPPQRECLYELALASKEGKPISRWVKNNDLNSSSTVRDVMSLRHPKRRKARQREFLASVTLNFHSYEDAANALADLLRSNVEFRVSSHQAFAEALKSILGASGYEKIQERLD
jgi:hypothetical protein